MANRKNSRKNRNSRNRKNRNRKGNMYGGACALGGAPIDDMSMATGGAQSLAQGRQFADLTRSYHGGFMNEETSNNVNAPQTTEEEKNNGANQTGGRRMYGGMAPLSIFGTEGTDVNRASAHLAGQDAALADAASYSRMNPDLPDNTAGQLMDAVNKGMAQVGGRRRRRSTRRRRATRGMRGGRRSTCSMMRGGRRRRSTRRIRGGRRSCCGMRGGQDPEPVARTNNWRSQLPPNTMTPEEKAAEEAKLIAMMEGSTTGGRRRRRMRGGAIYEGAPYSQGSSDMLLADDPSLQAQAAKMESPAWTSVQAGTY
jgi:hypothetical protein